MEIELWVVGVVENQKPGLLCSTEELYDLVKSFGLEVDGI